MLLHLNTLMVNLNQERFTQYFEKFWNTNLFKHYF